MIRIYKDISSWEGMRKAGKAAAEALNFLELCIIDWNGVSLLEIDQLLADYLRNRGITPACLGYKGYKHVSCISVNDVVCHGVPTEYKLQKGDIFNIDITVIVDGWHGDHSRMFYVPPITNSIQELLGASYRAMMDGIHAVAPGATIGAVEAAIEASIKKSGFSGVTTYGGHGIGREFHIPPFIGTQPGHYKDLILQEGMFFTIEPMVNMGLPDVTNPAEDGWTVRTKDGSLSAQWEHTIGVTKDGYEIFTH